MNNTTEYLASTSLTRYEYALIEIVSSLAMRSQWFNAEETAIVKKGMLLTDALFDALQERETSLIAAEVEARGRITDDDDLPF